MKEFLYLYNHYLKEFDANLIEVPEDKKVILDQSSFFPTGGGQPNDTGVIKVKNREYKVTNVFKDQNKIIHEVDKPGLKVGDRIHGTIDWPRRYSHMRAHAAAHIISEVIHRETKALITGNQISEAGIRIDFSLENFDKEKLQKYIEDANKIINQDLSVTTEFISREQALKIPGISKLAIGLPQSLQEIRIVKIGDFDTQADGGTHVKSTKEIGKLIFIKAENKGKNNRRIYVKLEP